jgi:hypothetical protein
MRELIRTNDPVLLSFVQSLLKEAGIGNSVLDQNMSVLEGSLGILPRRVLVDQDQLQQARDLLEGAELGAWISRQDNET